MLLKDAIALLQHKHDRPTGSRRWADLGCGSGLFTTALANLLPPDSIIYAVDKDPSALKQIAKSPGQLIQPVQSDFIKNQLDLKDLDGILMANSLHYVNDKPAFIHKITGYLEKTGCILIVEYNTDKPVSTWVPFPISFQTLKKLLPEAGFPDVIKIQEQPSVFNRGTLYSAIAYR